jgi:dTDP-4-dehydrorhamnose 3,5-epimerase
MIEGVKTISLGEYFDERGFFAELFRIDNPEITDKLVQFNTSYTYPNMIRAWHRHLKGQVDYFTCLSGCVKICVYDDQENSDTKGEIDEIIINARSIKLVRVPGILWHGFKALGHKPCRIIYGVNRLYDYEDPDEEKRPWNDPKIIPKSINGNKYDKRVGKPWDWNYPPHK